MIQRCAVVAHANFCNDLMTSDRMRMTEIQIVYRIGAVIKILFVIWPPCLLFNLTVVIEPLSIDFVINYIFAFYIFDNLNHMAHDDTDKLILDVCSAIKIDPPVQPTDIAVSHRLGKKAPGKNRQIIVKFATRNIRERVFSARTDLKDFNKANTGQPDIYINEDLTQFRANLAKKTRDCKKAEKIADTWNIYGKIFVKDLHNHVDQIKKSSDLDKH